MYYYKQIKDGIITAYQASEDISESDDLIQITETEYTEAIDNLRKAYDDSVESENESRIAELEKENAELRNELGEVRKQIRQYTA